MNFVSKIFIIWLLCYLSKTFCSTDNTPEFTSTTLGASSDKTTSFSESETYPIGTTHEIEGSSNTFGSSTTVSHRGSSNSMSTSGTSTGSTSSQGTTYSSTRNRFETIVTDRDTTWPQSPSTPEMDRDTTTSTESEEILIPEQHPETEQPYIPLPPPQPPTLSHPAGHPKNKIKRVNTEAKERIAMIIGIVAGALIAVVLVILLVLWFKSGDRTYKTEHDKSGAYGQGPNAALLGNARNSDAHHHHHGTNGSTMPLNGSVRNGMDKGNGAGAVVPKAKKRDSKDIKEWYV